jgi:hypothetical protein
MYPYMNEDVAFERLKDMQREMENSRLWAERSVKLLEVLGRPFVWAWEVLFLTFRPLPVAGSAEPGDCEHAAATDAA